MNEKECTPMPTNIKFLHADQIGGCVTLISTDTTKICIDFGENLPGSKHKEALEVEGDFWRGAI